MAKYMFIFWGEEASDKPPSPEELQFVMEKWGAWINEGFAKGWMLDPGDALNPTGRVVNPDKVVTDGPFAESKEIVGGYSLVQAASFEAAAEIAKGCPALEYGGKVEIRELAGLAPPKE